MWRFVTPTVIFAVLTVFWLFLTIGALLVYCWYSLGRHVTIGTPMVIFAVLTVFWLFWLFLTLPLSPLPRCHQDCTNSDVVTVGTILVDMWRLVHQWPCLLYWLSFDCFWSLVYQLSQVYQDCDNSVPIVKNSQKQSKNSQNSKKMTIGVPSYVYQKQSKDSQNSKNGRWCTNRHMSTQSPPNTQSRPNAIITIITNLDFLISQWETNMPLVDL